MLYTKREGITNAGQDMKDLKIKNNPLLFEITRGPLLKIIQIKLYKISNSSLVFPLKTSISLIMLSSKAFIT
jgi:hypothetical protein